MRLLPEKAKMLPKLTSNLVLKMDNLKLVFWSIATQNPLKNINLKPVLGSYLTVLCTYFCILVPLIMKRVKPLKNNHILKINVEL